MLVFGSVISFYFVASSLNRLHQQTLTQPLPCMLGRVAEPNFPEACAEQLRRSRNANFPWCVVGWCGSAERVCKDEAKINSAG